MQKGLMELAALEIYNMDDFYDWLFDFNPDDFRVESTFFASAGYESSYSIRNFGFLGVLLVLYPFLLLLFLLTNNLCLRKPSLLKHWVEA